MFETIQAIINYVNSLKRPELIDTVGGQFVYSDSTKTYNKIHSLDIPSFTRTVSNVESFAAYILEIASRNGYDKVNGKGITVCFDSKRAVCRLVDNNTNNDTIIYDRALSPQWEYLFGKIGTRLSHKSLITVLQWLRPSFKDDYNTFMRHYRKVSFDEKISVSSQPQVVDGKGGSSLVVEFNRNGDNGQTALPNSLKLSLQYTRDSKRFYEAEIEVDSTLNANNREKPSLEFSLLWADIENTQTQAVADEIADFKALVGEKLPELLVVVNY